MRRFLAKSARMHLHTTLTNLSMKRQLMCKAYADIGGVKNSYTMLVHLPRGLSLSTGGLTIVHV